jgi:hypothetical protein
MKGGKGSKETQSMRKKREKDRGKENENLRGIVH